MMAISFFSVETKMMRLTLIIWAGLNKMRFGVGTLVSIALRRVKYEAPAAPLQPPRMPHGGRPLTFAQAADFRGGWQNEPPPVNHAQHICSVRCNLLARDGPALPHQIFHTNPMSSFTTMPRGDFDNISEYSFLFSTSDSDFLEGPNSMRFGPSWNYNNQPNFSGGSGPAMVDLGIAPLNGNSGSISDSSLEAQVLSDLYGSNWPGHNIPHSFMNSDPYRVFGTAANVLAATVPTRFFSPPPLGPFGPLFRDPFGAGPSNWAAATPSSQPEISPVLVATLTPSMVSPPPTVNPEDLGYIVDSSVDGLGFSLDSSVAEDGATDQVDSKIPQDLSDVPVPMDCSLPLSIHSSPGSSPATVTGKYVPTSDKGKKPLTLKLSRKGDRVWNWVKEACPCKGDPLLQMTLSNVLGLRLRVLFAFPS